MSKSAEEKRFIPCVAAYFMRRTNAALKKLQRVLPDAQAQGLQSGECAELHALAIEAVSNFRDAIVAAQVPAERKGRPAGSTSSSKPKQPKKSEEELKREAKNRRERERRAAKKAAAALAPAETAETPAAE